MKRKSLKELKLEIDKVCLTGVDHTLFQSNNLFSLLCFEIADTDPSHPQDSSKEKTKHIEDLVHLGLVLKPNNSRDEDGCGIAATELNRIIG